MIVKKMIIVNAVLKRFLVYQLENVKTNMVAVFRQNLVIWRPIFWAKTVTKKTSANAVYHLSLKTVDKLENAKIRMAYVFKKEKAVI